MERFTTLTSGTVVLPAANIDTDQIIPARLVVVRNRAGMIWSVSMFAAASTTVREVRAVKGSIALTLTAARAGQ